MTKSLETDDQDEFGTFEDLEAEANAEETQEDTSDKSDETTQAGTTETVDIPDKYKDKSPAELIRMHQEAESALGRSGSEVGQLRRTIDDYIQSQTVKTDNDDDASSIDFDEDPEGAVKKAVDDSPKVKALEKKLADRDRKEGLENLKEKYNVAEILTDPDFAAWVGKSKVRGRLFQAADKAYDWEAAAELFEGWTERQTLKKQVLEANETDRKDEINKGSTGSVEGSSANTRSKKKYKRTAIIKLMNDDPKRYQAMLPEIRRAYAEKRVV